jgi:hypothetical protein
VVRIGADGQRVYRTSIGAPVTNPIALTSDGHAIVLTQSDTVVAIDASGNLDWFFDAGTSGSQNGGPAIGADGSIVFADSAGRMHVLEPDGRERLGVALDGPPAGSPAIDASGRLYVTTLSISAYSPDGNLLFRRSPLPGATSPPADGPTIGTDGALIVAQQAGFVSVLTDHAPWRTQGGSADRASFTELSGPSLPQLAFSAPAGSDASASAVIAGDGDAYVKTAAGDLIALDSAGSELWRTGVGSGAIAPLLTSGNRLVCASDQGRLTALDRSGRVLWFVQLGEALTAPLEARDRSILVGGRERIFHMTPSGEVLATIATQPLNQGAIALSASGLVAAATSNASLLIFPIDDPDDLRIGKTPVALSRCTPVWDRAERVYVLNDQDQLTCFASDGTLVYLASPGIATAAGGRGGPAVTIDQVAVFGAQDGKVYRVGLQGGTPQPIATLTAPPTAPPLIDGRGGVFVTAGGQLSGVTLDGQQMFPPLVLDANAGALAGPANSLAGKLVIGGQNGTIYGLRP